MKRNSQTRAGNEGFAIILAVLMLVTMTSIGLVASDISLMELDVGSVQQCEQQARARAYSCTQLYFQAVASFILPSLKINNLDNDEPAFGNYTPDQTVDCLIPGFAARGGAQQDGEGAVPVGVTHAANFSLDFYYRIIYLRSFGFGGPRCGVSVITADNDPFDVLAPGEVAVGMMHEQEVGMSLGPCTKTNPC